MAQQSHLAEIRYLKLTLFIIPSWGLFSTFGVEKIISCFGKFMVIFLIIIWNF